MLLQRLSEIGLVDFLILSMAVYRLSMMFYHDFEHGPRGIMDRIKFKLGVQVSSNGDFFGRPESLAEGILCYFCNSPWIGLLFVIVYSILAAVGWLPIARLLFLPLAVSGITILIAGYID